MCVIKNEILYNTANETKLRMVGLKTVENISILIKQVDSAEIF